MEYNETITQMSTSGAITGDVALSSKVTESYASVKEHIRALRDSSENHSDGPVKVTWTTFHTRTGHMVEKCAMEWSYGNTRMTDVVWIKRGQWWY